MAFLASRFEARFQDYVPPEVIGAAPTFRAYQEFEQGLEHHGVADYERAIPYFRRAFEADSLWALPLIRLRQALNNLGRFAERDSVMTVLEGLWDRLTPYERAEVQYFRAQVAGNTEQVLAALRRATELAPRSVAASNYSVTLLRENRPREALEVLQTLGPEFHWVRGRLTYWFGVSNALQMLERHEEALEAAKRAHDLIPDVGMLFLQSRALAALGHLEELNYVLDDMEAAPDFPVVRVELVRAVEALRAYGHFDAAQEVGERVIRWFEARPSQEKETSDHLQWYGKALFLVGRVDEAQNILDELVEERPDTDTISLLVVRACIAAHRGDTAQARSDLDWYESEMQTGERLGEILMYRGMIVGALGDRDQAIELIRSAYRDPGWYYGWEDRIYMEFDALRDHPDFQEFTRPKG